MVVVVPIMSSFQKGVGRGRGVGVVEGGRGSRTWRRYAFAGAPRDTQPSHSIANVRREGGGRQWPIYLAEGDLPLPALSADHVFLILCISVDLMFIIYTYKNLFFLFIILFSHSLYFLLLGPFCIQFMW